MSSSAVELGRKHGEQIVGVIVAPGGIEPINERVAVLILVLSWRIQEAVAICPRAELGEYLEALKATATEMLSTHGPIDGGLDLATALRAVVSSCRPFLAAAAVLSIH